MIFQNPYPICEFDPSREPLITPQNFIGELPRLPPRCVITFFRGELQELAEEQRLPVIGQQHSEVLGIPCRTGKTWTTDAIYRETPDRIAARRQEGCLTVEMEAAAFFAVSRYHDIPLAQLLYAGDDVSGERWDSREWDRQRSVRENLLDTAIRLTENFPIKQQEGA